MHIHPHPAKTHTIIFFINSFVHSIVKGEGLHKIRKWSQKKHLKRVKIPCNGNAYASWLTTCDRFTKVPRGNRLPLLLYWLRLTSDSHMTNIPGTKRPHKGKLAAVGLCCTSLPPVITEMLQFLVKSPNNLLGKNKCTCLHIVCI